MKFIVQTLQPDVSAFSPLLPTQADISTLGSFCQGQPPTPGRLASSHALHSRVPLTLLTHPAHQNVLPSRLMGKSLGSPFSMQPLLANLCDLSPNLKSDSLPRWQDSNELLNSSKVSLFRLLIGLCFLCLQMRYPGMFQPQYLTKIGL